MLKPEDLKAALESIEEENEIDLEEETSEEEKESNDAIDESVPEDGKEKEDESDDKDGKDEEGGDPEDTSSEEGGDSTSGDAGEEGGEEQDEGAGEEPGTEPESTSDDAKKELLDETPMPETEPTEQSVEIKDADDGDSTASPKEVALDMEEVGSLEKMLDTLNSPVASGELLGRVGNLFSNVMGMTHGLESFGLDKNFRVTNPEDLETLKTAIRDTIDKHKNK